MGSASSDLDIPDAVQLSHSPYQSELRDKYNKWAKKWAKKNNKPVYDALRFLLMRKNVRWWRRVRVLPVRVPPCCKLHVWCVLRALPQEAGQTSFLYVLSRRSPSAQIVENFKALASLAVSFGNPSDVHSSAVLTALLESDQVGNAWIAIPGLQPQLRCSAVASSFMCLLLPPCRCADGLQRVPLHGPAQRIPAAA
jgi:hypothetical protein